MLHVDLRPRLSHRRRGRGYNARESWVDGFDRTVEVDEPDASNNLTVNTCYKYDALNNLIEVDQGSQTRTYAYDGLSRLTSSTTPESGTTNLYYTTSGGALCAAAANALCRRTDARAITTTYAYDALSRLTSKTYSNGALAAYFYYDEASVTVAGTTYTLTNTKARLSHTSAASGTALTIHSYDAMGRTQDLWQCTPFNCSSASIWNVHYTYDLAGDLTTWTHPANFTITQAFNSLQQITGIYSSLNDATHPQALGLMTYAPTGQLAQVYTQCPTGAPCTYLYWDTYTYNNRLQPVEIQLQGWLSGSWSTYGCLVYNYYSGMGNPTSCAAPGSPPAGDYDNGNVMGYFFQDTANPSLGHTTTYTYDYLNRLASSVATGSATHNLAFTYDRYGNMACTQNAQTNGLCPQWTYDATTNRINTSGFSYDAAGDLTGDGTHTYQWDPEGRLKSLDNYTKVYTYNALRWRVEKQVGTAYTEILYDASGESLGENNRSTWTQSYVNFNGRHLGIYQNNATYTTHANTLGSTAAVTDYTGAPVEDKLFYPWGQDWHTVGTLYEERFAKLQHRDSETNLDPTPNRMFSSNQGRWLSPDPVHGGVSNPQSLNRYAYAANNPTRYVDPSGLVNIPGYDDGGGGGIIYVTVYAFAPNPLFGDLYGGIFGGSGPPPVMPPVPRLVSGAKRIFSGKKPDSTRKFGTLEAAVAAR